MITVASVTAVAFRPVYGAENALSSYTAFSTSDAQVYAVLLPRL